MSNINPNPESFEAKLAVEKQNEDQERKAEFREKYKDILSKNLWEENGDFISTIETYYERYWDITLAIKEAFKNIKWSEKFIEDIDELIKSLSLDEKKEEQDKTNYWKDSTYYPIINRLVEWWYISIEKKEKAFNTKNKDDLKNNVINLINWLSWADNEELKKSLLVFISPDTNNSEKKLITEESFEKSQFYKDFKWEWTTSPDKNDAFDILIANNYISIPSKNKEKNRNSDLLTALDICKSKLIEKESPDFRERNATLISKIEKTSNIWEKYSLTKDLYRESLKDDWIKSSTTNSKKNNTENIEQQKSKSHFENLRKIIKEHKENTINNESLKEVLGKLATKLTPLDEFLQKNPQNPEWIKLVEETNRIIKDPTNENRQSIEVLISKIDSLVNKA